MKDPVQCTCTVVVSFELYDQPLYIRCNAHISVTAGRSVTAPTDRQSIDYVFRAPCLHSRQSLATGLSLTDCELVGEREEVVDAVPDVVVLQVVHQVGAVALHLVTAGTRGGQTGASTDEQSMAGNGRHTRRSDGRLQGRR